MNNWRNSSASFINKTKNYFVLDIPESEIIDSEATNRNIFIFGGRNDLLLYKYKWWLKNFDSGQIIASYKYHITSYGPVSTMTEPPKAREKLLGDYVITEKTVNGRPVYQKDNEYFLFMNSEGTTWYVGRDASKDRGWFLQRVNYSLGPDPNLPWEYYNGDDTPKWKKDDATLRAYAFQV